METKKKRVVQIKIDDSVKKLTIMGEDKDQQVVMREELSEQELEQATGGRIQHYYEDSLMHHNEPGPLVLRFPSDPNNP